MKETITRGDVTITLHLNADRSVDLRKKIEIDYPGIENKMRVGYPTGAGYGKPATINDQFELVASLRRFDATIERIRVGQRIKELREEAGLTQEQLAEKTGLQKPNISRIESGKYSTGQDILSKIAHALGKSLDII